MELHLPYPVKEDNIKDINTMRRRKLKKRSNSDARMSNIHQVILIPSLLYFWLVFSAVSGILPTKSQKYCKNWENHNGSMADISEEDRKLRNVKFTMINQDKEENQTNQSWHEHQETKKQSLTGSNTIHSGVGNHFTRCNWNSIAVIVSPEPEKWIYIYFTHIQLKISQGHVSCCV